MSGTFEAVAQSWTWEPWLALTLLTSAAIYLRGWRALHARDAERWSVARLAAFWAVLGVIYVALASPIEQFVLLLLQVHMLQHLLLMLVVPPLVWWSAPLFPLLRGLPEPVRTYWVAPLLRSPMCREMFTKLTHPLVAWPVFVAATWFWHTPRVYDLALRSPMWHWAQHASFLFASLLFWYPVLRPYPARPRWSRWLLLPYLLLADVQNTVLAAWLTFSAEPLYPHYREMPRIGGISVLDDQAAAGVLMWVPGSLAFLVPLFWLAVRAMMARENGPIERRSPRSPAAPRDIALPVLATTACCSSGHRPPTIGPPAPERPALDLARLPFVGRFLRWKLARPALQIPLLVLAALVIVDGLFGPRAAPLNLAGTWPWIHWRGLVVLALLAVGNVFCLACPFTLPRRLAGRWLQPARSWPRMLRSKWLALALVILFLWSYEVFALWDRPGLTAWIALGYFVAAFAVDATFSGAAFCKYVCPIGQFNFVQSLISPFEVRVLQPQACASCATHDCLRGNAAAAGCGLNLFQPRKSSNFDCTFCLDCLHACPQQNVGVLAVVPGRSLWQQFSAASARRLGRRADVAALVLVLVFGALANAAGMVAPVVAVFDQLETAWSVPRAVAQSAFSLLALIVAPLVLVGLAAEASARWAGVDLTRRVLATRFALTLVPLGFAVWFAHYSFHFLTSYATAIPVSQRFAANFLSLDLGDPAWQRACCAAVPAWIVPLEFVALDVGLLLSLYAAYRLAMSMTSWESQAVKLWLPWAGLVVLLFAAAVWIVLQPMEMRGTMSPATDILAGASE